jgi:hypothetical protein
MICIHQKAAVLKALWRVIRTPPGSKYGAYIQRGNLGTWESHLSPCKVEVLWGTDPPEGKAPGASVVLYWPPMTSPAKENTNRIGAYKVSRRKRNASGGKWIGGSLSGS